MRGSAKTDLRKASCTESPGWGDSKVGEGCGRLDGRMGLIGNGVLGEAASGVPELVDVNCA